MTEREASGENGTPGGLRPDLFLLADPEARSYPVKLKTLNDREAFVKRWSIGDRRAVLAITRDAARPATERTVDLLRLVACHRDGTPLFPEGDDSVWNLPGDVGDELIELCLEANGLTAKANARGKDSSPTPPARSG